MHRWPIRAQDVGSIAEKDSNQANSSGETGSDWPSCDGFS